MNSDQWKTYRTRFLVRAKQLNSVLSFTDHLGRQHCGRKGDYLVESCDGVLSIARRQIFEDIYVPMSLPTVANAQHGHDCMDCTARSGTPEIGSTNDSPASAGPRSFARPAQVSATRAFPP